MRAFVATRLGGHSWVVDLVPNYEVRVGSAADADVRVDVDGVLANHATLSWNGSNQVTVTPTEGAAVQLNGDDIAGATVIEPGDEIRIAPATLVVNLTFAPTRMGRRSLTHHEFAERVNEELARASRSGRYTCLLMLKSRSGDGSRLASAALSSFRDGDVVGTYAHDEIEFLLPDTPPKVAKAVVERLLETSGLQQSAVGLAVSPDDGDSPERVMRAARDALASALRQGGGICRPTEAADVMAATPSSIHTQATRTVVEEVTAAAEEGEPLLLVGEPSSGKRYYARLFHEKGERKDGPFVVVQCGGLVDQEALGRAFGPEQGDVGDCIAETAQGGTLVLDEIGDLPLPGQRRLLRLFEEGSEDYNLVSTTHRDLPALCQVGAFVRDLYDKISTRRVTVPALRMRAESIVPLAQNFAAQFKSDKPVKLSAGAIDRMRSYSWPGNVLELQNAIERAVTLADGGEILAEHLPGEMGDADGGRLREHVGSVERDAIIKALADNNYNQTHAAKILGISRRALIYKMEKYGLKPPPAGKKDE